MKILWLNIHLLPSMREEIALLGETFDDLAPTKFLGARTRPGGKYISATVHNMVSLACHYDSWRYTFRLKYHLATAGSSSGPGSVTFACLLSLEYLIQVIDVIYGRQCI
jgi:hypothetical protein